MVGNDEPVIVLRESLTTVVFPLVIFLAFCLTFLSDISYLSLFFVTLYLSVLGVIAAYQSRGFVSRVSNNLLYKVFLFFYLWLLLSILWSVDVSLSIRTSMEFYICFWGLLLGSVLTAKEFNVFLKLYISFALLMCVVSAYQVFTLDYSRPISLFHDWNANGSYFVTALIPLSVLYVMNTKYYSVLTGVGVSLFLFSLGLTQSRGAFLSLVIVLIVLYFVIARKPTYQKRFRLLVVWMFAGLFLENISASGSVFRLVNSLQSGNVSSSRFSLWDTALTMYLEMPYLGSGIGTLWGGFVIRRFDMDPVPPFSPHNDYLQLLAEVGPVGLVLFLLFTGLVAYRYVYIKQMPSYSSENINALAAWLALLAFFVHIFFNLHLYSVTFLLVVGLFSGYLLRHMSMRDDLLARGAWEIHGRTAVRYLTFLVMSLMGVFHITTLVSNHVTEYAEKIQELDKSLRYFRLAHVIAPYSSESYIRAGEKIVSYSLNNGTTPSDGELILLNEALNYYQQAKSLSRYSFLAYYNSAELMARYSEKFLHADIVDNYDMALRLRPNRLKTYISYSEYLLSEGMNDVAWKVLEKAWGRWFSRSNHEFIIDYCANLITLREQYTTKDKVDRVKLLQSRIDYKDASKGFERGFWLR